MASVRCIAPIIKKGIRTVLYPLHSIAPPSQLIHGISGSGKTTALAMRLLQDEGGVILVPHHRSWNSCQRILELSSNWKSFPDENQLQSVTSFCYDQWMNMGGEERLVSSSSLQALLSPYQHTTFSMKKGAKYKDLLWFYRQLHMLGYNASSWMEHIQLEENVMQISEKAWKDYQATTLEVAYRFIEYETLLNTLNIMDGPSVILNTLLKWKEEPYKCAISLNDISWLGVDDIHEFTPCMWKILELCKEQIPISAYTLPDRGVLENHSSFFDSSEHPSVFTKSHRCSSGIVQASSSLRAVNNKQDTYNISPEMQEAIEYYTFSSAEEELYGIPTLIENVLVQYPNESIAVLTPNMNDLQILQRILQEKNISFSSDHSLHLFEQKQVSLIISFLRCLVQPSSSKYLFHFITSSLFDFPHRILALIMERETARNLSLHQTLRSFLKRSQNDYPSLSNEEITHAQRVLTTALDILSDFSTSMATTSTSEVIQTFLKRMNVLDRLITPMDVQSNADSDAVAALLKVVAEMERGSTTVHAQYVVPMLLTHADFPLPTTTEDVQTQKQVHLSTLRAASSSDVEADTVLLVQLRQSKFPGRYTPPSIPLPTVFLENSFSARSSKKHMTDVARYVLQDGILRARKRIVLTSVQSPKEQSRGVLRPSALLDSLTALSIIPSERKTYCKKKTMDSFETHVPDIIDLPWVSYSQIYEYTACPYRYYLSRILKVSTPPSIPMLYGKALHAAIATYSEKKAFPNAFELAKQSFHDSWGNVVSKESTAFTRGLTGLEAYIRRDNIESCIVSVEEPFMVYLPEIKTYLKGVWDRIEDHGNDICIVEYKSNPSQRKRNVKTMAASSLQLPLYTLAYERVFKKSVEKVTLEIIETGERHSIPPDTVAQDMALTSAVETVRGIQKKDFNARPGYMNCSYCPFLDVCAFRDKSARTPQENHLL